MLDQMQSFDSTQGNGFAIELLCMQAESWRRQRQQQQQQKTQRRLSSRAKHQIFIIMYRYTNEGRANKRALANQKRNCLDTM